MIAEALKGIGKHMSRVRYQKGWVEETGKRIKKWKGHFHVYEHGADGKQIRRHRSVTLGPKAGMRKGEAQQALQRIIEENTPGANAPARPDDSVSFGWFFRNRYLPLKTNWKRSTREAVLYIMERHVLRRFGETSLRDLSRFDLQTHLNEMATRFSESVVHKERTWVKAVLDEALEQGYLSKNPARKLIRPITRTPCKRFLTPEEYQNLMTQLQGRDRLILSLLVVGALRPGELFALRWRSLGNDATLRIEEAVYRGKLGTPKTRTSAGVVVLPEPLVRDLENWYELSVRPPEDNFIFPSSSGTVIDPHNYLQRVLKPAARRAGIEGLTFQALRRTFSTQFHRVGTVKEQQAQMRHARANLTLDVYTQVVPEGLRTSLEAYHRKMSGDLNTLALDHQWGQAPLLN